MQTNTSGRPKGSRNAKPTKQAIAGYYGLLRSAADDGDTNAAAHLIQLDLMSRSASCSEQPENKLHGV